MQSIASLICYLDLHLQGANLDPDLSRPRAANYKLMVAALDGGLGADQLVDVATVNITITDVNNKLPR